MLYGQDEYFRIYNSEWCDVWRWQCVTCLFASSLWANWRPNARCQLLAFRRQPGTRMRVCQSATVAVRLRIIWMRFLRVKWMCASKVHNGQDEKAADSVRAFVAWALINIAHPPGKMAHVNGRNEPKLYNGAPLICFPSITRSSHVNRTFFSQEPDEHRESLQIHFTKYTLLFLTKLKVALTLNCMLLKTFFILQNCKVMH